MCHSIFTATPTERITHYTLQAKSCAKRGSLPPLDTPIFSVLPMEKLTPSSFPSLPRKCKTGTAYIFQVDVVCAYFVLAVDDFAQHDFFCPVANVVTSSHPFHLIVRFQFLGNSFGNFHLLHNRIQPFLRLLVHICKI